MPLVSGTFLITKTQPKAQMMQYRPKEPEAPKLALRIGKEASDPQREGCNRHCHATEVEGHFSGEFTLDWANGTFPILLCCQMSLSTIFTEDSMV